MALRNQYTGRPYNRQDIERQFDNTMSYGAENQKKRRYDQPDYDERFRASEQHYDNYNDAQDDQRLESIYGDDTRNYRNANQGAIDREWWEKMRNRFYGIFGSNKEMRGRRSGGFSGRGPKNYKRNEQRIFEDVCDLLLENDGIDAGDIEVRVDGNYIVLSGTVHTRSEKRRAEDLAASVPGVWDVENRLRVLQPGYLHS